MSAVVMWTFFTFITGIFLATFSMHNRIRLALWQQVTDEFNRLRRKKKDVSNKEVCDLFLYVEKEKKIRDRKLLLGYVVVFQVVIAITGSFIEQSNAAANSYEYLKYIINIFAISNLLGALCIAALTAWDPDLDLFGRQW